MVEQIKPHRTWRIVLVGSLALNLLMVGAVGGAFLRGGGGPQRGFELQLGPLSDVLSLRDRRKIGEQIRRGIGRQGQSRAARLEAFENLISVVAAQPFDPELLAASIRDQQKQLDNVRDAALNAFVAHLTNMTVGERSDFADKLRDSFARRGNHDGRHPPPEKSGG
jgi:uncharacterized membrane protein